MEGSKEIYQNREECLERWIRDYAGAILQTCVYLMPDKSQAEEAIQNTLIKAWRYLGSSKNKRITNERAWLLKIASNTCKDFLREGWHRYMGHGFSFDKLPPKMLCIEDDDRSIRFMVLELSEKLRMTVLMYYFQGLSQQEIADLMNVSLSTVNRRLRSAEGELRRCLESG